MRDPRLKLFYVVAVGVAALATARPPILLGLLGLQVLLWFVARLPASLLLASVRRLAAFVAFVLVSNVFFGGEEEEFIYRLAVGDAGFPVNLAGLVTGLLLSTRIVTVVLASAIVRNTGDPNDLARGLRAFRVPVLVGGGLDLVLASLGPQRGREVREGKKTGGPGRDGRGSRFLVLKRLLHGDAGALAELIERNIARARERAAVYAVAPAAINDLAVLGGLGVLAMSLRFLKLFPGLPVAPGHKSVVVIPLYLLANRLTTSRWGATQFGAIVGLASLLMGMGKLGPFDVLRHLAPGLFVDLVLPPLVAMVRTPPAWIYGLVGAGAALMRLATVMAAGAVVEVPRAFYIMLIPMIVTKVVFGFLSGFVTAQLMRAVPRLREAMAGPDGGDALAEDRPERVGAGRRGEL